MAQALAKEKSPSWLPGNHSIRHTGTSDQTPRVARNLLARATLKSSFIKHNRLNTVEDIETVVYTMHMERDSEITCYH